MWNSKTLTFQQIYRTHKWLYVFTSELGLMAGGGYIAFYEGKETVIFTSLKWKSSYFFSCLVSSGVNRLGNSTWCLTKPSSPICTWSEIGEDIGIPEPKRLANTDYCLSSTYLELCIVSGHFLWLPSIKKW